MNNIVPIGYRGSGKTRVAKALAKKLKMPLVCIDKEIERRSGLSVSDIVERYGWERFRDMESEMVREASQFTNCIIDPGGGVILREENVRNLKEKGIIFWLKTDIKTLRKRMKKDAPRPSLTGSKSPTDEIEEVLMEREPKYQAAADCVINGGDPLRKKVAEIVRYFRFKRDN